MEKKEFKITKSTTELYKIRHESGMYWADIIVDDQDKRGRIQIASDYGSWQNYWGDCGCSFKEFLTKIDIGYFAGKVGEQDWFDQEATHSKIKQDIIESRKDDNISAVDARELWDSVNDMFLDVANKEGYCHYAYDNNLLWKFYQEPCAFPCITGSSPQFRQFWKEPWQAFIKRLKEELTDKSE